MAATVRALLRDACNRLPGEAAALEAEVLLANCLGRSRAWLYAHGDATPDAAEAGRFSEMIGRRLAGEPISYLTGHREFWSLDLQVGPATLIPRPETELLVELTLALLPDRRPCRVVDLGTGSGAIALALASERPSWQVLGVEQSRDALAIATANCSRLGLDNVRFQIGDWCAGLPVAAFAAVVANPPYICSTDTCLDRGDLRFEPRSALVAGADGLDDLRRIIATAKTCLQSDGWLLVEHGHEQSEEVRGLLAGHGYRDVSSQPDLSGHQRVSLGVCPA